MFNIPESLKFETDLISNGILPKPRMAIIHNTYKCNQKCSYCFFDDYNKNNVVMPTEKLLGVVDELSMFGVKSIQLCGGGEPLIAPDMEKVFERITSRNMRLGIITNGSLFKGDIMKSLVNNAVWVRIGLDTTDPVLYEKVHGVNHCELVINNIREAVKYKKDIGSKCEISVKLNLFEEQTLESIQKSFEMLKDMGIYSIQVKHVWDKNGKYFNPSINKAEIGKLNAYGNMIVRKTEHKKFMNESCWITPVQTTIDANGDVFLCCYYQGREPEHKIGNIFENKFQEIWDSPLHKEKIKTIGKKECLKHDCRFHKYMQVINYSRKLGLWEFV